ncbi:5'-nucleotidase domain-containing protein 1 [Chelonia mydas]|uniref:5'-nucleotidase domain-containing protein 1 n=1 Tax=Chelonia mydas TaxID=8469 RepID=M7BJF9_CHEMY|nr:5'-nucleotidase domain-containing protein 1 [Chelonia mydas]
MSAPCTKRSPTWSNAELLDLISIWGEEAAQSQLCSSHRNYDTYGQMSRCMIERGYDWDTPQCRVKVKELQNTYHKAREANRHSSAAPISCWFYQELDPILGSNHTSTAKTTVDTSVACMPVKSGPSQEEDILDEDGDGQGKDSEVRDACIQELFSTLEEASQSQQSELGEAQTGEEAPGMGNRNSKAYIYTSTSEADMKLELAKLERTERQRRIEKCTPTFSSTRPNPRAGVGNLSEVVCRVFIHSLEFKLIYDSFARYLVTEKGYDKELLTVTPESWDFCRRVAAAGQGPSSEGSHAEVRVATSYHAILTSALLLKVMLSSELDTCLAVATLWPSSSEGSSLQIWLAGEWQLLAKGPALKAATQKASHGTKSMTPEEILEIYGRREWKHFKTFSGMVSRSAKYYCYDNYFDLPGALLCARIVDCLDKHDRQTKYDFWKDVIAAIQHNYKTSAFKAGTALPPV